MNSAQRDLGRSKQANVFPSHSYNRYLAIAARTIRRSLKEDKRIIAERRGESELKFAKWQVSFSTAGSNAADTAKTGQGLTRSTATAERQALRDEERRLRERCCHGSAELLNDSMGIERQDGAWGLCGWPAAVPGCVARHHDSVHGPCLPMYHRRLWNNIPNKYR
jgi:hypothetical protein